MRFLRGTFNEYPLQFAQHSGSVIDHNYIGLSVTKGTLNE